MEGWLSAEAGLVGLILSAFTSATVLPGTSEVVLTTLIVGGSHALATLILVATIGNVGGSMLSCALGRGAARFSGRWFFPTSEDQLERARGWYARYGRWSLLATALPIIGDPLTVIAGVMRERWAIVIALVTISKLTRYIVVALAVSGTAQAITLL